MALTLLQATPSGPERAVSDAVISAPVVALSKVLRLLGAGVWQARTRPLEIISWPDELNALAMPELVASPTGAAPEWESWIYPPDLPTFRLQLERFVADPSSERSFDYRVIVGDGELVWLRQWFLESRPDTAPGRQLVTGLVRAVSEEKRLQWEIAQTTESERARIGQEVHDDLGQILTGIGYLTHVLHQKLQAAQRAEAAEVEQINLEIQAGLERTRALAHGLLPAKSDFNSLQHALRDLARLVEIRFGMQLTVTLPPKPPAHSRESLLHLYRIVQEAASNAFKHGRASRLDVTLECDDNGSVLSIEDNGSGLPQDAQRAEGIGLNVMRNRAELLGGWLELCNSPRGGVLVHLHLPPFSDA